MRADLVTVFTFVAAVCISMLAGCSSGNGCACFDVMPVPGEDGGADAGDAQPSAPPTAGDAGL
jgi:hypothetical protein